MPHEIAKEPARLRPIILGGSAASSILFFASLWFPVFYLDKATATEEVTGVIILLFGWMGIPGALGGDPAYIPWIANPLLLISLIFMLAGKHKLALAIGAAAFSLGVASFGVKSVLVNAAGHKAAIVGYGAGFYLSMAFCSWIAFRDEPRVLPHRHAAGTG